MYDFGRISILVILFRHAIIYQRFAVVFRDNKLGYKFLGKHVAGDNLCCAGKKSAMRPALSKLLDDLHLKQQPMILDGYHWQHRRQRGLWPVILSGNRNMAEQEYHKLLQRIPDSMNSTGMYI